MTVAERIKRMVVVDVNGCWLWQGAIDRDGYGRMKVRGRMEQAHRPAYEAFIGTIPDGQVIDHLCRVRRCLNPVHLDPVDNRTNLLRGETHAARNAAKQTCPRGHVYDRIVVTAKRRQRYCTKCKAEASRRSRSNPRG